MPLIATDCHMMASEQARLYVATGAVLGYAHATGTKEARALRTARTEALRLLIACAHHFEAPPPPSTASSTPSMSALGAPVDAAADASAGGGGGGGGGSARGGARAFTARAFTALDSAEAEAAAAAVLHRPPRSPSERELHRSHAEGAQALLPLLSGWLQVIACDCM